MNKNMLWIFSTIIIFIILTYFLIINKLHNFIIKNYIINLLLDFSKYKYIKLMIQVYYICWRSHID